VNASHPTKLLPDIEDGIVPRSSFTDLFYQFGKTANVQIGFDIEDGEEATRVNWLAQVYTANFARHSGPVVLLPIMQAWDLMVRLLTQRKPEGMGDALFHTSEEWVLAVLEQEFIDGGCIYLGLSFIQREGTLVT
jgi:hypothetical protein